MVNPEEFGVLDPNKSKKNRSRKLFIPSVAVPAPTIMAESPSCPKIEEYFTCILTHEGEVHLTDMVDLPWLQPEGYHRQELRSDTQAFLQLLETIVAIPTEFRVMQIHRGYLGEFLAFTIETLRANTLSKAVEEFSFASYLNVSENAADSLNVKRDIKLYPDLHRNKWGFEMARLVVESLNYDRSRILKFLYEIRKLMVGEKKARKMFLKEDLANFV